MSGGHRTHKLNKPVASYGRVYSKCLTFEDFSLAFDVVLPGRTMKILLWEHTHSPNSKVFTLEMYGNHCGGELKERCLWPSFYRFVLPENKVRDKSPVVQEFSRVKFWDDSLLFSNLKLLLIFTSWYQLHLNGYEELAAYYKSAFYELQKAVKSSASPQFHISIKSIVWKINQSGNIAKGYGPSSMCFFFFNKLSISE